MKKNKIIISVFIFVFTFLLIGVKSVYATNGPASENSYIELYKSGEDYGVIYDEGEIDNNIINGATYDESTNTLTLNNLKSSYELIIYNMGDDFKLDLVGDNELSEIYLDGDFWDTTLNITGNGSLAINKNKEKDIAVEMNVGKIIVDETVTLKIYVSETSNDFKDYVPYVIGIMYTDTEDGSKLIKFKNGQEVDISNERDYYHDGTESIPGFGFIESENPRNYTIVIKDNKKYGMYISGTNYIITGNEIKYDEVNEEYFIDSSLENEDIIYTSLNEVTSSGYIVTEELANITKEIVYLNFLIFLDEDENEYALYNQVFLDNRDSIDHLYDITTNEITLANGKTYTVLKNNNNLNIDELNPKYSYVYVDTYSHYVYLSSLEILPNTYEFIKGANEKYMIGHNGLTFRIQALYSLFNNGGKVFIDGKEIDEYTSKEGSTIISLSDEYLSTLEEGEHSIKVLFNNGKSTTTNFTIIKVNNPNTSDNIIYYISMLVLSIFGLIGAGIYLKRKYLISK